MTNQARSLESNLRLSRSKCECAGLCSASEDSDSDRRTACHFFSWSRDNETCELGHMDLGWHFNYTDDEQHVKQVSVDTGETGGVRMPYEESFHKCSSSFGRLHGALHADWRHGRDGRNIRKYKKL